MLVPKLLLDSLEELLIEDFYKFKWYLSQDILDHCKPIWRARLEDATRVQTIRKIVESYGEESAVNVTVEILRKMNFNGLAEELNSRYAAGKSATPAASSSSSSSAAAPPAAPAAPAGMTAQHGAVIFAPNIVGGSSGSWNITINK